MADNSNRASRKGKERFLVWTDDETELLLRCTLNYKTTKLAENVNWDSCRSKYGDIMDEFVSQYPRQPTTDTDFPHDVNTISKGQLVAKIKNTRRKYRAAVDAGRCKRDHGRPRHVRLFFELCSQIWGGGSPPPSTRRSLHTACTETGSLEQRLLTPGLEDQETQSGSLVQEEEDNGNLGKSCPSPRRSSTPTSSSSPLLHLPLSSLRLIVPPLQIVSATLLEIVKEGAVMLYGMLEEFVSTVLETVPDLLTYREGAQLVMGLRARVVLELCRTDELPSPHTIQTHLTRIKTHITKERSESSDSEVKTSMTNFFQLVNSLVDHPGQRDDFYQNIFPTVFGPKYDSALEALLMKFLSSLQKLLPVPNLEQTADWLSLSPSILKECVEFLNQPQPLNTLIQHHKHHGHLVLKGLSSSGEDCILSSLSHHFQKANSGTRDTHANSGSMSAAEGWQCPIIADDSTTVEKGGEERHDSNEDPEHSVEAEPQHDQNDSSDIESDKVSGAASASFKCHVCSQGFSSFSTLERHQMAEGCCLMNSMGKKQEHSDINQSTSQSSLFEKTDVHPQPQTDVETIRTEKDIPLLASTATHESSMIPNIEPLNGHDSLICRGCNKTFTYPKSFDKHNKSCFVMEKIDEQTCLKSTAAVPHNPLSQPLDEDKGCCSPTEKVNPLPELSLSPEPSEEPVYKRSSRAKTCSICREIFTSCHDLTKHMRGHTEQSLYPCSCGKDFDHDEDCEQHCENESSGNSSKRNQQQAFSSSSSSQASSDPHKPQRKMRVDPVQPNHLVIAPCNFQSTDQPHEKHLEENGRPTSSADLTEDHQRKPGGVFKCTMCDKNFVQLLAMKQHYWHAHTVARGSYTCPLCKRTFGRLCELLQHHQNQTLYQCSSCVTCFTKLELLNRHNKVSCNYICETCRKSFKSLASLNLHQKSHREPQPWICSECDKQFSSKDCLKAHMVRHTGGYTCPTCGKKFNRLLALKWHQNKHTGKYPYLCDTCGKGWPSVANLRVHMVQHTEGRPFKCEDCGVCYKRRSSLMSHRRAKHLKLRPFVCEVCSKAFRLNSELKRHFMAAHTGERPHKCFRCHKTFKRKYHLRVHKDKCTCFPRS